MKICGKEVDFKISRVEDAAKMNLALEKMKKKESEVKKINGLEEILTSLIHMFAEFFLDVTGQDVLKGCSDVDEAKKAYVDFLREVKKQKQDVLGFSLDDIE